MSAPVLPVVLPFHDRCELVLPLGKGRYRVLYTYPAGPPARLLHLDGACYGLLPATGRWLDLLAWRGERVEKVRRVTLPGEGKIEAAALYGDYLYVGGELAVRSAGFPALGVQLLRLGDGSTQVAALPGEVQAPGKGIDGMFVDPGRLVVVDDILDPKYLVVYERRSPGERALPRLVGITSGLNETIQDVTLGPRHFALTRTTLSRAGRGCELTLHDRRTLEVAGRASRHGEGRNHWYGAALRGERVYLAAAQEGVGTLDLKLLGGEKDLIERMTFRPVGEADAVAVVPAPGGCFVMRSYLLGRAIERDALWLPDNADVPVPSERV